MLKKMFEDVVFDFPMVRRLWKPMVKKLVTGSFEPIVMKPADPQLPQDMKHLGLYLHVPFCNNLCPFCPYNRVTFEPELYAAYEEAVHTEIDRYARQFEELGRELPPIVSIYIGGGTPTIVPEGLQRILTHMQEVFGKAGDICVELHPAAMDDACLDLLEEAGITMLSVGVESLTDRLLEMIGRSHDAATATDAIERAVARGFASVNADLMFALPTQTVEELDHDLKLLLSLGVDQISTYPIFGFPYSDLGRELELTGISRPPGDLIREMLALIRRRSVEHGFEQCAVWSFLRPQKKKFSSITRHHYLGFGPSAASMTGEQFYVNTFSVEAYVERVKEKLPVALVLPVAKKLEMAYWLYWRVYDMKIPRAEFAELFDEELDAVYGGLFKLLRVMGIVSPCDAGYRITDGAAYWIHRLQNEYSLNYINRLWGKCKERAWPERVRL